MRVNLRRAISIYARFHGPRVADYSARWKKEPVASKDIIAW
jgi:hypothetical protein